MNIESREKSFGSSGLGYVILKYNKKKNYSSLILFFIIYLYFKNRK